jgi:hypothetical protein
MVELLRKRKKRLMIGVLKMVVFIFFLHYTTPKYGLCHPNRGSQAAAWVSDKAW